MVFSDSVFLFMFLPLTLAVYYAVPFAFKNTVLFLTGLLFYAWGEPVYVLIMLLSTAIDYCAAKKHLSRKIFRFKRSGAASAAPLQFLSGCAHDYKNRYKQRSFHPPPGKKRAYVCKCTLFSELRRNFQP